MKQTSTSYIAPEVQEIKLYMLQHLLVNMSLDGEVENPDFSGEEF